MNDVLDYLDIREQGGYSRKVFDVKLLKSSQLHCSGSVVKALSYIGLEDNPFYYRPNTADAHSNDKDDAETVEIISAAHGPSGANSEYLLNLARYLNDYEMSDAYLNALSRKVSRRIGPWRLSSYRRQFPPLSTSSSHTDAILSPPAIELNLFGWGSNEFSQLSPQSSSVESTIEPKPRPVPTPSSWTPFLQQLASPSTAPLCIVAGGASSGILLPSHQLILWGSLVSAMLLPDFTGTYVIIEGVENAVLGHDHFLLLLSSGRVAAFGNDSHGQCTGPSSICTAPGETRLIRTSDDPPTYRVQWPGMDSTPLTLPVSTDAPSPPHVLKLAVGLRHSAAITSDGGLYTWGDGSHGQCPTSSTSSFSWQPPDGSILVDVSCGARHTMVVASNGRVYSCGGNKYGTLGRGVSDSKASSAIMEEVKGLPSDVQWQRVTIPCLCPIPPPSCFFFCG